MDKLRALLTMQDPTFNSGETHTATVTLTIPIVSLACSIELWLSLGWSTKAATSRAIAFISTGAAQEIRLPITMPTAPGNYMVNLDIASGGQLIATYQASEKVIVPSPPPPLLVTVHLRAANYGLKAKYWVVLSGSIVSAMPVPITKEIVLTTIPADDFTYPSGFIVDLYTADPIYGGGVSLRDSYPNLGFGCYTARNFVDGEVLTWIAQPNGWWRDQAGNWV